MNANIRIKNGLNVPVAGRPEQTIHDGPEIRHVALSGLDYVGLKPRLLVKEGDQRVLRHHEGVGVHGEVADHAGGRHQARVVHLEDQRYLLAGIHGVVARRIGQVGHVVQVRQLLGGHGLHGGEGVDEAGAEVTIHPAPPEEMNAEPQAIPLDVLFEDEHLLVIDKPAGLVVHPAAGHPDGTLQNGLLFRDPALIELPRAGIVHRLDKDTTGLMVVAKSEIAGWPLRC